MKLTSIEQQGLANFKNGLAPSLGPDNDVDAWTRFGLEFLMEAGRSVRSARLGALDQSLQFKADQTPSVLIERTIEERLRGILSTCASTAAVFGEEGGGQLKRRGITVAIDPIDGTWSFLSRSETITTSLAMFKDAQVFLGMISNPATGEIGYASPGNQPRLLQFSVFGEDTQGTTLPLQPVGKRVLLVNAHPSRGAGPLFERLFAAWNGEQLQMVKAVGGSPSWGLFEAAKGAFVYVNLWSQRRSDPFDLAAGATLLRAAGGDVVGLDGLSIAVSGHRGPFVAGIDASQRQSVLNLLA